MTYLVDYINAVAGTEQTEVFGAVRKAAFNGGVPFVVKPGSDTAAGVLDGQYDSASGYVWHLRAGPNSGPSSGAIGVGTDEGSGGGILVSHKNLGWGYRLNANPMSGYGFYTSAYSPNPAHYLEVFAGGNGFRIRAMPGGGFADGATTQNSATFTSASAVFTAGDVGQTITQLTSKPGSPANSIPAGTTIASFVNATTVTLSAQAPNNASGILFSVGGRTASATQEYFSFYNEAGTRQGAIFSSLLDWSNGARFRAGFNSQAAVIAKAFSSGQTGDLFQAVNNSDVVLSRFNKAGAIMTRVVAAPADADMVNSELVHWLDATPGATKVMFKAKDSSGTVRTASLNMA